MLNHFRFGQTLKKLNLYKNASDDYACIDIHLKRLDVGKRWYANTGLTWNNAFLLNEPRGVANSKTLGEGVCELLNVIKKTIRKAFLVFLSSGRLSQVYNNLQSIEFKKKTILLVHYLKRLWKVLYPFSNICVRFS